MAFSMSKTQGRRRPATTGYHAAPVPANNDALPTTQRRTVCVESAALGYCPRLTRGDPCPLQHPWQIGARLNGGVATPFPMPSPPESFREFLADARDYTARALAILPGWTTCTESYTHGFCPRRAAGLPCPLLHEKEVQARLDAGDTTPVPVPSTAERAARFDEQLARAQTRGPLPRAFYERPRPRPVAAAEEDTPFTPVFAGPGAAPPVNDAEDADDACYPGHLCDWCREQEELFGVAAPPLPAKTENPWLKAREEMRAKGEGRR